MATKTGLSERFPFFLPETSLSKAEARARSMSARVCPAMVLILDARLSVYVFESRRMGVALAPETTKSSKDRRAEDGNIFCEGVWGGG